MFNKFWVLIAILLLCCSCANFYDPTVTNPAYYVEPLQKVDNFDISGRFAIKTSYKNNYGNFTWVKSAESEVLDLQTPLGSTVAQIIVVNGINTLVTKDNTYVGDKLNQVLLNKLGVVLPLQSLHYWITGIAIPDMPIEKKLAYGFRQLGWNVEYLAWQDTNHPRILQCTKDDLIIKLLIQW